MKRKKKEYCGFWHCICIQVFLYLFCHGLVSGLPSYKRTKRKFDCLDKNSHYNKVLRRSQRNVDLANIEIGQISNTKGGQPSVGRNLSKTNVTMEEIQDLYHSTYLELQKLLKRKHTQHAVPLDHKRNSTGIGRNDSLRKIQILGKSPLPPFKTRQHNLTLEKNKNVNKDSLRYFNRKRDKKLQGKHRKYNNDSISYSQIRNNNSNYRDTSDDSSIINRTNKWEKKLGEENISSSLSHFFNLKLPFKYVLNKQSNSTTTIKTETFLKSQTRKENISMVKNHGQDKSSTTEEDRNHMKQNGFRGNTSSTSSHFINPRPRLQSVPVLINKDGEIFPASRNDSLLKHKSAADNQNEATSTNNNKGRGSYSFWKEANTKLRQKLGSIVINQNTLTELGEKKDKTPDIRDSSTCLTSDVQNNRTMSLGLKAGYFFQQGNVATMDECIYHCCAKKQCDVAFMIKENCFLIQCLSKLSCRSRKAHSSGFFPRLAYIFHKKQYINAVNKEHIHDKTKERCHYNSVVENMTFYSGLDAGRFTPHGKMATLQHCIGQCCNEISCDVALMVDNLCYSIHCKNKDSCKPIKRKQTKETTSLVFVSRENKPPLIDVTSMVQLQNNNYVVEKQSKKLRSSCPNTNTLSHVYKNVKLNDGLNAGNFTDMGHVTDYKICVNYCCNDDLCNVALTIKNNCFLVACKTYKGCSTYPTFRPQFDPHIVYLNWEAPKEKVFTKGKILYKNLGCWREDKSFGRVLSLEGTDHILHDSYKLRTNAVEKCAVAAQKRHFNVFALHNGGECKSGAAAQEVYKKQGNSKNCSNGSGDHQSHHVYYITKNGTLGDLGCWSAVHNEEGFTTLESTDGRIMGNYRERFDSFLKCAEAAMDQRYTLFALRDGGQCFGGFKTITKYNKHGVSKFCKNGLGSHSSKNVYQIVGSTKFHVNNEGHLALTGRNYYQHSNEDNAKQALISAQRKTSDHFLKQAMNRLKTLYNPSFVKNKIFTHGLKAGTFISKGAVNDMMECIHYCTKQINCTAAFMIQKYCFNVKCFTNESCTTKEIEPSMFQPRVLFVRYLPPTKSSELSLPKKCQSRKIYENVTLFGGINAGNFTELGEQKNMEECIGQCCKRKRCDVAFMLGNDCYSVSCKTKQLCGTKPANNVKKYKPRIAYLELSKELDSEKPLPSCWSGEVLINHTLTGGINAGVFYSNGNTEKMSTCMKYCCQQRDCDLAFLIDQGCYTVHCKSEEQCKARKARQSHYIPQIAYKHPKRFTDQNKGKNHTIKRGDKDKKLSNKIVGTIQKEFATNYVKSKLLTKFPQRSRSCKVGPVQYNVTLKMGIHSGQFKKLGQFKLMKDCIKTTCKEPDSDVAFMLENFCYSVKCYNADLCQTKPAFISSIGDFNINPAVAFLNKSTKEHHGYSRSEIENHCVGTTVKENVTLVGGKSAGKFINNGERSTVDGCISACCNIPSCDIAFMSGKICYSVECFNETLCEAVTSKLTTNKQVVAYVARTSMETKYDAQDLQFSSISQCPLEGLNNLKVYQNKTLVGGFESGNYTFLGRTKNMITCMQKCCRLGKCDVAYSIDGNCYGIECFSNHLCTIDDRVVETTNTQISIIKNVYAEKSSLDLKYTFPIIYGVIAVIIVIAWAYWMKRKKILSKLK